MIDSTKNIIIFLMTVLLYTSFCALAIIFRTNKKFFERNSNMNFSIIGKLYFPIIEKNIRQFRPYVFWRSREGSNLRAVLPT